MNLKTLTNAIKNKKIVPFYMPLVDLKTERILGLEVLARILDEDGNAISPLRFIPVAEKHNLMHSITKALLEQACAFNNGLFHDGIKLKIALNLSSKQIEDNEIIEIITNALDKTKMLYDLLEIEVTENEDFDNINNAIKNIDELKGLGIETAIDDFGIDFADFNRLEQLPVTKVKIDASYIFELGKSENKEFVKEVVKIAKKMKVRTLAEGVNTEEQIEFLKKVGCDMGQGFYYGAPMSEDDILDLLKK